MASPRPHKRQSAAALTTRTSRTMPETRAPYRARRAVAAVADSPEILAMKAFGSQAIEDAVVKTMTFSGSDLTIIPTPFNLNTMVRLPKQSDILGQCITAMVTNVVGHGWALEYVGPKDQEASTEAQAEKVRLENLLKHPNEEYTLDEMLERVKTDKETMGMGYIEAIRDQQGNVDELAHLPGHTMRMTEKEAEATEVTIELMRDGKLTTKKVFRRFRRFVQSIGSRTVYFKEFGDPRNVNPKNGKVDDTIPIEQRATEVIVDAVYAPGEIYGLPRWLGQLPGVIGSRETDLTNLDFFKNNCVPALAVLVSGGMLGGTTMDQIEDAISGVRGRDAQNRVVFVEAFADPQAASADGTLPAPKLDIKPLAGERQNDALFLEYKRDNKAGVRSAFRLPAIFTGDTTDYTYATAKTSFEVAESQVFGPERAKTEAYFNGRLLATLKLRFWALKLQPARITDPQEVITALKAFDEMGAMTPNLAIGMANQYFDLAIPLIDKEWGNWPFAIVKGLAEKGQLHDLDEIAEIPEPVDPIALAEANAAAGGGKPGEGKAPIPTGTGKGGKAKAKPKPAETDEDKAQKVQAQAMKGVRRQLMDLRALVRTVGEA